LLYREGVGVPTLTRGPIDTNRIDRKETLTMTHPKPPGPQPDKPFPPDVPSEPGKEPQPTSPPNRPPRP
jgi:hypothetical protein